MIKKVICHRFWSYLGDEWQQHGSFNDPTKIHLMIGARLGGSVNFVHTKRFFAAAGINIHLMPGTTVGPYTVSHVYSDSTQTTPITYSNTFDEVKINSSNLQFTLGFGFRFLNR